MTCPSMNVITSSLIFCVPMIIVTNVFKVNRSKLVIASALVAVFVIDFTIRSHICSDVQMLWLIRIAFIQSLLCIGASYLICKVSIKKRR